MKNQNYRDDYFARGHWGLKLRQTLVALLGWLLLFVPIVITGATLLAHQTNGRWGHFFWHYPEGFVTFDFLAVLLLFALAMTAVFCLTVAYVQLQRSRGLVDKWPLYDPDRSQGERQAAETFMTGRLGPANLRRTVRTFTVSPEQNLANNQLKQVVKGEADER